MLHPRTWPPTLRPSYTTEMLWPQLLLLWSLLTLFLWAKSYGPSWIRATEELPVQASARSPPSAYIIYPCQPLTYWHRGSSFSPSVGYHHCGRRL